MPNKTLLPPPYLTLEDINGATITGGTVTFLETGTAVLAVVYADANGTVISANPLTVDAAGRYTVFLTPGQVVDVEYRDASGTLIKTVPAVSAIPAASGNVDVSGTLGDAVTAGQVVYLSDGSGGKTAGRWFLASGITAYSATLPTIGMTTVGGGIGASGTIRIEGRLTDLAGLVVGARYFVSNTAGTLALTQGTCARLVGQADTTTSLVLWPDPPDLDAPNGQLFSTTGIVAQLIPTARTIFLNNATPLTIQGIKAGSDGQRLRLFVNPTGSGAQVDFPHLSSGAAAVDRLFNWVTSAPTSLVGGGVIEYEYSQLLTAWKLITHEQGGWMTPAFNAADYSGTGGMTWTVAAGNVSRCAYYLSGRRLSFQIEIVNSAFGGVASNSIRRGLPGAFQAVGGAVSRIIATDASGPLPNAVAIATGSNTLPLFTNVAGAPNWTLGAVLAIGFDLTIEVV